MFGLFKKQEYIDTSKIQNTKDIVDLLIGVGVFQKYMEVSPNLETKFKHLLKEEGFE